MRAIIFALGGILLAGTAVAQESPPTCHGLNFQQCKLGPGCRWMEVLMKPPGWERRVCVPMCVKEPVFRITKGKDGGWVLRPVTRREGLEWLLIPRGLIP
jgi:hypothetical protein